MTTFVRGRSGLGLTPPTVPLLCYLSSPFYTVVETRIPSRTPLVKVGPEKFPFGFVSIRLYNFANERDEAGNQFNKEPSRPPVLEGTSGTCGTRRLSSARRRDLHESGMSPRVLEVKCFTRTRREGWSKRLQTFSV